MRFSPIRGLPKPLEPEPKIKLAAVRMADGDMAITAVRTKVREDGGSRMEDGKAAKRKVSRALTSAATRRITVTDVTLTVNEERGLVELRFPDKPDEATRAQMKAAKWRWYGPAACWFHKHTPENLAWGTGFVEAQRKQAAHQLRATNFAAQVDTPQTAQEKIRASWLLTSKPSERTRHNFQLFYHTQLIALGHAPIMAVEDDAGNCRTCGEAGRCPGWHYEGEFAATHKEVTATAMQQATSEAIQKGQPLDAETLRQRADEIIGDQASINPPIQQSTHPVTAAVAIPINHAVIPAPAITHDLTQMPVWKRRFAIRAQSA